MKVLFAVKDISISESIIKKYRKQYQEILTYKNVFYYNAIIKEIQKNKDYDRIIISEDVEEFANNNNYDTIDKFIFEKLDSISDEANDSAGRETSIILICDERRQKGNELLSKLFSIGIYNALLGEDRSLTEVCKLIKNPRTKKEAKSYYKIDSESSEYRAESENEVSEVEIQNILNHFRKLGKSTEKYASSFDTIAAQYTEEQLKIIVNCLPAKVKSILASSSEKYQKLVSNSFGLGVITQENQKENSGKSGLNVNLLENASSRDKITKPIVIPSGVKKVNTKRTNKLEDASETTKSSSIRVQKKPKSLQEQIIRAGIDEREKVNALKKQQEIESSEKDNIKEIKKESKKENVSRPTADNDYLDEFDDDFAPKKNQVIENNFEDDDEIFGKTEKRITNKSNPKVKSNNKNNKILEDDTELEDFSDLEEFDNSDDIFENEDAISDFDVFSDEELDETSSFEDDDFGDMNEVSNIEEFDEEDDIFEDINESSEIDEFDEDDDIFGEIEEPVKPNKQPQRPQPKEEVMLEDDEDDIFGDMDEIPEIDEFDEDDDIFGDIEEPVKPKKQPQIPQPKEEEIDEDDIFGDIDDIPGLDEFDDEADIFEEIEEPVKPKKQPQIPQPKEEEIDEDDIFGDIDDIPGLDEFDDDEDIFGENPEPANNKKQIQNKQSKEEVIKDEDDIFADIDDIEDFDEDLFGESEEKINIKQPLQKTKHQPQKQQPKEEIVPDDEDIFGADNISSNIDELDDIIEDNISEPVESIKPKVDYSVSSLNKLLTKEKKIVNFIGTTKNGTSFLVNNLAKLFSSIGINTAVLDMTKNKNSYYIFTNNDDSLRKIAYTSFEKLENGYAEGIRVDKNLTIYTALPNSEKKYNNAEAILSTLAQNHSLILVDCDFETDYSYFALCQELYLVQSMDILTMQPLTTFLRDLQVKQVLEPEKIRIVINKEIKVRDLTAKAIIGALSYYKDPGMSVMVELFNKDIVQACSIPFEDNTYSKYLEAMVNCEISLSGYSKVFMAKLKNLGEMIYPLNSKPSYSSTPITQNYNQRNRFSNNMNNTLDQMKKKY